MRTRPSRCNQCRSVCDGRARAPEDHVSGPRMVGLQSLYRGRAVLTAVQLQLQHEQLPLSLQARAFTFIQQFGFRPSPSPPCTQAIHIYTKISDLDLYIRLAIYANTRVYVVCCRRSCATPPNECDAQCMGCGVWVAWIFCFCCCAMSIGPSPRPEQPSRAQGQGQNE
eukprot:scaffold2765_cov128-Isochrysis_galbana.AAC.1